MNINKIISQENFPITCPKCKTKFTFLASQVGTSIVCPNCRVPIYLNDDGFSDSINNINKQLNNLKKMFK